MSKFVIDDKQLQQHAELPAFEPNPAGKPKFALAKQLDAICLNLNEDNYLDFNTLSNLVLAMSADYFNGKPSKTDEGDVLNEWAFAKNLYYITRKLKALNLDATDQNEFSMAFEQLKYSYLLHRIYEVRDMISVYMGRWGFSDLWSCLDRFTYTIESLHKKVSGKKINAGKRFQYWMNQLTQDDSQQDEPLKQQFFKLFVEDHQQLWTDEITRVYQS